MPYPIVGLCLTNVPPKEQSSSVPVVCNKACVHSRYTETSIQGGKLFETLATRCTVRFRTSNTYLLVNQNVVRVAGYSAVYSKRFFIRQCFFFFHCLLLFYGYSKNHCRHKRVTKPQIDSLYKKCTLLLSKIINI